MVTKEISENAELWFGNIQIVAKKVDGVPTGYVSAQGGFNLPSNGSTIETVRVSEEISIFLGSVATKLSLDPAVLYQAICDSLEDTYVASLPVVP
jgi:hypothetical protein